jgi:hypothetical protein
MGQSRNRKRLASTAEEAAQRIARLRHVYNQGYLTRATFETMKRNIEARVAADSPRPPKLSRELKAPSRRV